MKFKKWDCLTHKWKWFWLSVHQPFHNCWFGSIFFWLENKSYKHKWAKIHKWLTKFSEKHNLNSKWGEVWLIWAGIPLKHIPPAKYPWAKT